MKIQPLLCICLILVLSNCCFGQLNLVPNYSFEDTLGCPIWGGEVYKTKYWKNCNWSGTSDFYHSCGSPSVCGVPANSVGYQYAATGNAYGGFICYSGASVTPTMNYREYLFVKLTDTLKIGQTYYVQFKVSGNDDTTVNFLSTRVNKIGARFLTVPIESVAPKPAYPDNFAHVYTNNVVLDRVTWTPICGIFTADSAYQYIVLGNFFKDAQTTNVRPVLPVPTLLYYAYYYIDDVFVSPFPMLCGTGVGIEEYSIGGVLELYPNPNNGLVNITSTNAEQIQSITLQNSQGIDLQKISEINSGNYVLDLSSYETGVYGLKITVGDAQVYKRVVKY